MIAGLLMQSRLKDQLRYDESSGLFFWKASRPRVTSGKIAGYRNSGGYIVIQIDGKAYAASRLAFLYMTGRFPELQIDHINGDRSDNSWKNLRNITQTANLQNQRKAHAHNVVGLLGVSVHKSGFKTEIKTNGRRIYLGCYKTAEEAHLAYVKAKRELHEGCTL